MLSKSHESLFVTFIIFSPTQFYADLIVSLFVFLRQLCQAKSDPACRIFGPPTFFLQRDMGLLYLGTPLAWDDAKPYADHVRKHGITQFLHIWDNLKNRYGDELLWGDEVPYPISFFARRNTSC